MGFKWLELTINDVCSVTDCQHKTAPVVNFTTDYRMLRTVNIRNGNLRDIDDTKSVTKETYEKWSVRGYLKPGDIILTREAPMGEVALLRKNEKYKYFLGQRMLQLQAFPEVITPEFLYYSLQTRDLQHQIKMNEGTGSVVSNIRIPLLKKMKLNVPPLVEQKKITKLLFAIDNKILLNNKIISNLEQLSQTLFKQWFIDFEFPNEEGKPYKSSGGEFKEIKDEEIPINWKIGVLDDIVEVIYGAAFSSKFFNEVGNGLPLIRIRDLKNGKPQFFTNEIHKKATVINPGDLLIGMDAEFKPTLWKGTKAYLNQRICLVRPKKNIINKLFLKFLLEPQMRFLESAKVGTTVIHLSKKDIDSINIAIPTESILKKFSILIDPILEEIIIKQKEIQSLTQLRDTLLPKLLSGEIEIPDNLEV